MVGKVHSTSPAEAAAESPSSAVEQPTVDLNRRSSEPEALALIAEQYAVAHDLVPLTIETGTVLIAAADPDDAQLAAELQVLCRRPVQLLRASRPEVQAAIRQRYSALHGVGRHVKDFTDQIIEDRDPTATLNSLSANSPVVEVVNLIISQGLRDRASDIHVEPQQKRVRVRFRIDGLLTEAVSLPTSMGSPLASRIKVMANLDIVDRHRAQDGQLRVSADGRVVDIRVSTTETIWGEKVVLRLLDQSRSMLALNELGLADQGYARLKRLMGSPYGMVVVSGPTGSGKTTTLYAAINELDRVAQNITTIEDPVEYTVEDINQIQIRKVANLTFANGLRSILRQDPDVILVGEIRDRETAEIAIQSALTGHLVLSSLHATDSAGVVQRFMEMGIEGFLISSALIGVVAQRLVRRICNHCREPYQPTEAELELWREFRGKPKIFYRGRGCPQCAGTGYRGRTGIYEVLPLSDEIKRLVSARASAATIREQGQTEGIATLRESAVAAVAADLTTLAEVIRCVWLI